MPHYKLCVRTLGYYKIAVMTQTSSKNPYRPGVGVRPLYLAGRDAPRRRFDAMLRAAPEQQQDLLLASAQCPYPPLRSSDLGSASAKTPGNVNVLLGRLVDAGALYRTRKGEYAYTAPKFRDYLLRRAAGAGTRR